MADAPYRKNLHDIVKESHSNSASHGFWDNERTIETLPSKLALIHSEVSEALESYRNPDSDNLVPVPARLIETLLTAVGIEGDGDGDYQPPIEAWGELTNIYDRWRDKPRGFDIELADIIIRVADLAGAEGIDLDAAVQRKHAYNVGRPHKHGRVV